MKYFFSALSLFLANYIAAQDFASLTVMNDNGGYTVSEPFQLSEWNRFLCQGESVEVNVTDTLKDGVINYFETSDGDYVSHITLGNQSGIVDASFDCDFHKAQADSIFRGIGLTRPQKVVESKPISEEERRMNECMAKEGAARTDCFCNLVDFFDQKYDKTTKTIYLKNRQRAFQACLEGE